MSEMDPETLADLRLRESTQRDRTRKGEPTWSRPRIIGAWKCRVPACPNHVPVTQDAFDMVEVFNRELARREERPLDTKSIMYCDSCAAMNRSTAAERRRKQTDAVADVIRQIFAGETTIRIQRRDGVAHVDEREALRQLEKWGHPDIAGLEYALAERRKSKRNGRRETL